MYCLSDYCRFIIPIGNYYFLVNKVHFPCAYLKGQIKYNIFSFLCSWLKSSWCRVNIFYAALLPFTFSFSFFYAFETSCCCCCWTGKLKWFLFEKTSLIEFFNYLFKFETSLRTRFCLLAIVPCKGPLCLSFQFLK
jgi:hypothetical protein